MDDEEETAYFGSVEDNGCQIGIWKKGMFYALSNFKADFVTKIVDSGAADKHNPSGYVFKITHKDGRILGNAYVSCKDSEESGNKWARCLRNELSFPSLRCNATNTQLGSYLMKKLETNIRDMGDLPKKMIVTRTGLQSGEENLVWVFNEYIHINEDGELIDPKESPYIWPKSLNEFAADITVISNPETNLRNLLSALKDCYLDSTPAALLTLGGQVLCTHYEALNKKGKFAVPSIVLIGNVNIGKSKASRAALSMLGVQKKNFISSITDSKARAFTSTTTLGVVFDDPQEASDIADKILYHFDFGKSCTQSATYEPCCTFITSVNDDCLKKLCKMHPKYISRVVLVPFLDVSTNSISPSERWKKDMTLARATELANTIAPLIVRLRNSLLSTSDFENILEETASILPSEATQRIQISYSLLLFSTFTEVGVCDFYKQSIWEYFKKHIVPAITSYQLRVPSCCDKKQLFEALLIQAIKEEPENIVSLQHNQVKSFLRVEYSSGKPNAVCILIPHLEHHLQEKEISYDKQLLTNITSTFDGQCKGSIPKTFLSIGSHLKDIPKGVKGRKQSGAVYHRCIQFQKKAFTTDTFVSLVEAFNQPFQSTCVSLLSDDISIGESNKSGEMSATQINSPQSFNSTPDQTMSPSTASDHLPFSSERSPSLLSPSRSGNCNSTPFLDTLPSKSSADLSSICFSDNHSTVEPPDNSHIMESSSFSTPKLSLKSKATKRKLLSTDKFTDHQTTTVTVYPSEYPSQLKRSRFGKFSPSPCRKFVPAKRCPSTAPAKFDITSRISKHRHHKRNLLETFRRVSVDSVVTKSKRGKKKPVVSAKHCQNCGQKFTKKEDKHAIGCDNCPRWYHNFCVKVKDTSIYWKCQNC